MNNDEMKKLADNLKNASESGKLDSYIKKNVPDDVSKKLNDVLSDKDKLKELLSSEQAKELMKKFKIK